MSEALHLQYRGIHGVYLGEITVILVPDSGGWFAQGVQIDYGAWGETLDQAKDLFAKGLALTIEANLKQFESIDKLLKWAPGSVLEEVLSRLPGDEPLAQLSMLTAHDFRQQTQATEAPFGISFMAPAGARKPMAACQ